MLLCKVVVVLACALPALACNDCYGPKSSDVTLTRNVRRMQPGALHATSSPKGPLAWGQLNFLHTTDTHGWLEGHILQANYGADWGDFTSFVRRMNQTAAEYDVDLLVVDTGDLHDGNGLSDATPLDGELSNPVFENINYDLLTIGNHELYVSEVAYETFYNFSKVHGDRYLTSNVEIFNPSTGDFEYIGKRYRHFTTPKGVRIMAFGVLYDFSGNSNVSRVTFAEDLVEQSWFKTAVMSKGIDMFVVLGHTPARSDGLNTFETIFTAIRKMRPHKPIQFFGGHTHVRDFVVYDRKATALESGRYCETLGWLSMNGLRRGATTSKIPADIPQASRPAKATPIPSGSPEQTEEAIETNGGSHPLYSRRYIDWNRLSFAYHAKGSQSKTFETKLGKQVTKQITADRKALDLGKLYGCAPQTWCESCKPFGDPGNIYTILSEALAATVINQTRADNARIIILNTGSVRYDLVEGPFTYDDSFIISPFNDTFQYLPQVPYSNAKKVLGILNGGPSEKRRSIANQELNARDFNFSPLTPSLDECRNPPPPQPRSTHGEATQAGRIIRRQSTSKETPGYTTTDDFGTNGDDTIHLPIPYYAQPNAFQANASFPTDGSEPNTVDVVFLDFLVDYVVPALRETGLNYSSSDVMDYLPPSFSSNSYLPAYARLAPAWQMNVPNCPVGEPVGG